MLIFRVKMWKLFLSVTQLTFVEYVGQREPRTSLSTILVFAPAASNLSIKSGTAIFNKNGFCKYEALGFMKAFVNMFLDFFLKKWTQWFFLTVAYTERKYPTLLFCFHSLLQWLKHSRKEYCELCKHRFAFTPSKSHLCFKFPLVLWNFIKL